MSEPSFDEAKPLRRVPGQSSDDAFLRKSAQADDNAFVRKSADLSEDADSDEFEEPVPRQSDAPLPLYRPSFAENRVRTSAGFNAYMNQRSVGAQRSRLQDLRQQHGWSWFRSKNSAGGRAYRDELQAKKWRFLGGGLRLDAVSRDDMSLLHQQPSAKLAGKYRLGKEALQAGAGWKRFIPFTSARRNYKTALNQFRTGDLGNDSALTPFDRLMNSKSARRVMNRDRDLEQERNPRKKPFNAEGQGVDEVAELQGLLGSDPAAGPGVVDPANGGAGSHASGQQPVASNEDAQNHQSELQPLEGQSLDDSFDEKDFEAKMAMSDDEQSEGGDDEQSEVGEVEPSAFQQFLLRQQQELAMGGATPGPGDPIRQQEGDDDSTFS